MAVDATPKLAVRESLLAKIETTTGTAESLVADDGKFNIYNIRHTYEIPSEERPAQASFGSLESVTGERYASIEFESDFCGSGTSGAVPDWATTFLVACGFTRSSAVFSLAYNASQPTLTIGYYQDGVKFAIAGAAGTVKIPLRTGMPARLQWKFTGKVVADADVALVTPTAFNTLPPRFAGDAVTFGSDTPYLSQLEIDVANTLVMRPYQADLTGGRACIITGRNINVTADPELQLVATRDWYTKLTTNATETLSAAVGVTANNIITIASSYLQWTEIAKGSARNGLSVRNCKGALRRDSLSLTFS